MNIVSISLTDENLLLLKRIQSTRSLRTVSEAVRSALLDANEKLSFEEKKQGSSTAVLVVYHSHSTESFVSKTKHRFQSLIKSQNHYCAGPHECVDQFLLNGSFGRIQEMRNALLQNRELRKLVLVPL